MNVLIVDDHPTNRKLLRVSLEAEHHVVLEASDGLDALKMLNTTPADAIISDILMPNMDGFRLCLEIRQHPKFSRMPFVIYTSTYDSPTDRELAKAVGADSYIVKPAPIETIVNALRQTAAEDGVERQVPKVTADSALVLKQYNQGLVSKLEEKNLELRHTLAKLQQAHDQIMQLNHNLEQRVQQRAAELSKANNELNRQNSEIQNFYHTLCHELKTPLTSAREFTCLVLDELGGPISGSQREYLDMVKESCDQMRRCLDDLLDASRLDTGKLSLMLKRGSLANLVTKVIKSFESKAASRAIHLASFISEGLPDIPFDEYRMVQIVSNLLNNAVKFTPDAGTVEVRLEPAAPDHPGWQQISVNDTGHGIPEGDLDRVFDRLYQVKDGEAASGEGMGLGLFLCRELILLHGGEIFVESELGKGSTFRCILPQQPSAFEERPNQITANSALSEF